MHANEILLLAYYIAAIHIEEAFHGRRIGTDSAYEPFGGIVLTDTFNLHTEANWLPERRGCQTTASESSGSSRCRSRSLWAIRLGPVGQKQLRG